MPRGVPKASSEATLKARVWEALREVSWDVCSVFDNFNMPEDYKDLDKLLQKHFAKETHEVGAIGPVPHEDFVRIRDELEDSCLSEKTKRAFWKAMGLDK